MPLTAGTRLGPYEIVAPLGAGGMGEVYRARDTRLPREVALKVLSERAEDAPERVRRFQQEARAASLLNHPNIVVVYEAGEAAPGDGEGPPLPFLAMEMVNGEPLKARLERGELPLRTVLDLGAQLADGLSRAHESGIVHRDLKPSNILVAADGLVKIVDFGLAKLLEPLAGAGEGTSRDETGTSPGALLGTPSYMSPEQARGEDATPASDQFALGSVLYEMLTRRRAFARRSAAETISAILRDEPTPIAELRPGVPAPLRWIVERCLAKEPRDRYASTQDLARDLRTLRDHLTETGGSVAGDSTRATPRIRRLVVGALLAVIVAAATLLVSMKVRRSPEPDFRRLTFRQGIVFRGLLVPRSSNVLYTAAWEAGPAQTFTMLPEASGLDRSLEAEAQLPMAFSEDGAELLVLLGASRPSINAKGTLAVWPAVGGRPRQLVANAGWADWAADGRIVVFVRDLGAARVLVRREGGVERTLFSTAGAVSHVRISTDRTAVAFIHHASRRDDAGEVRVLPLDGSGPDRPLTQVFERCLGLDWNRRTSEIWFTASETPHASALLAVDRAGRQRTLHVLPGFAVLENVSVDGTRCLLTLRDERMTLAVRREREAPRDLTWLGLSLTADISPDGRTVLFWDGGASERSSGIWLRPIDGGEAVRLGDGEPKRFSRDGSSIVALTRPAAGASRFLIIPVGAGAGQSLAPPEADSASPSFADADTLLFVRRVGARSGVWKIRIDGTGAESLGASDCDDPMASPSGRFFLAICGERSAVLEVHTMAQDSGRKLFELPSGDAFTYARWGETDNRVFGVSAKRRFLSLDSGSGIVSSEQRLPALGMGEEGDLVAAAVSPSGSVQAYSALRTASRLYLSDGIR